MEQARNFRKRIKLAYEQAPWRIETRLGVSVLLVVIIGSALAAFYTDISARTIALGRQVQMMQVSLDGAYFLWYEAPKERIVPMEELTIQITELRLELARLTSHDTVQARLDSSGYKELDSENVVYLAVPGYIPEQPAKIGLDYSPQLAPAKTYIPYRDSLVDAVRDGWRSLTDMVQRGSLP